MRRSIQVVVAALAVTALASPAYGAISRISFKKGTSSATVSGRFKTIDDEKSYLLRVGDGQTIKITGSAKTSVFVIDPMGDDATDQDLGCNAKKQIDDTISGDYEIQVSPCLKYDNPTGPYKLTVSVR